MTNKKTLDLSKKTLDLLTKLTPREKEVFRRRFGEKTEESLEGIEQDFLVSRERILQIEKKALERLNGKNPPPRRA